MTVEKKIALEARARAILMMVAVTGCTVEDAAALVDALVEASK